MRFSTLVIGVAILSGSAMAGQAIRSVRVASGLTNPIFLTYAPDDFNRLFVVQQNGQIRIRSGGSTLATPFLNISSLVTFGGEQGLLGLAFHPNYATNGVFYV